MKVGLLSLSVIADDPRVRRQGDAIAAAGHDVVAVGFGPGRSPDPNWPVLRVRRPARSTADKIATAVRLLPSRVTPRFAAPGYWTFRVHHEMYERIAAERPDRVHANDWRVLPIAARLHRAQGTPYVYDSHEWAIEENIEQRLWRLTFPAHVAAIEAAGIRDAAAVVTVAEGIADLLQTTYALQDRPTVIANVPPYQEMPFRRPGDELVVLYQGVFNPDRGLDTLVRSVEGWRSGRRLQLRGLGPPAMVRRLEDAARRPAVKDRVDLLPPAPMTDLVRLANEADIGVHPIPGRTRQSRYALPNKLFEYIMAGLAVCVSDVPEMARVVGEHDVGLLIRNDTEAGIADAINSFDSTSVAAYKQKALDAARVLCWETEQAKLLAVHGL